MMDLEKMKSLIKGQWEEYRYSIEKTQQSTVCDDEKLYGFYLDRAKQYKYRAQGMEDLLYSLGYIVLHCSDGTCVDIYGTCVDIIERQDRGEKK